ASPASPGKATSTGSACDGPLFLDVAVLDERLIALPLQELRQLLHHEHGTVPAARAADRDGEVSLALGDILRDREPDEVCHLVEERLRRRVLADVADHRLIPAVLPAQLPHVVRIGEEADIEHEIGLQGKAIFEAEGAEADDEALGAPVGAEIVVDGAGER